MATKITNRLPRDMDKKKLETFKKRLEERQLALRKMVSRTEEDGRIADQDTAQDIADRAARSRSQDQDKDGWAARKNDAMRSRSSSSDSAVLMAVRRCEPLSRPFVYQEPRARSLLITQRW